MSHPDLLSAALALARWGAPVFPVAPRTKVPTLGSNGLLAATQDERVVRNVWAAMPHANIGVRTGARPDGAGLVVLDVDPGGEDALHELERVHGALPVTMSATTPRGGEHYYFRHPGGAIRTSAGALGAGLDVRADGAYVVAPPSTRCDGAYVWDEEVAPAAMPEWLIALACDDAREGCQVRPAGEWLALVEGGITEGRRNSDLTRLVGHLLRRYVPVDLTAALVHSVNATHCKPPLSTREVDGIVDSIADRECVRRARRRW